MSILVATYALYLILSIAITIWVGRTLHKNGRVFLLTSFDDDAQLADSVNHLLVVGFYLVNIGFVALAIKLGLHPHNLAELMETVSVKVGTVLLVLGGMHFFNLFVFSRIWRRAQMRKAPPPVQPSAHMRYPGGA